MMDTDEAEELLRSYYATRTAEAKTRGPHGGMGDQAAAAPGNRRGTSDRYARLDGPRAALVAAAAVLVMMVGLGLTCRRWDARPLSAGGLSLLTELRDGVHGLYRAMDPPRDSAPRLDSEGERL